MSELDDYLRKEMRNFGKPENPNWNPDQSTHTKKESVVDVKIVGIDIPFGNLVSFMILAAIAAIPAIAILFLLGLGLIMFLGQGIPS